MKHNQIFFDVTVAFRSGLNTGIQKVVKEVAKELEKQGALIVVADETQALSYHKIDSIELFDKRSPNTSWSARSLSLVLVTLRRLRFLTAFVNHSKGLVKFKEYVQKKLSPNYTKFKEIQRSSALKLTQNDVYITFDAFWNTENDSNRITQAKSLGAKTGVFIHDLFPITNPHWFEISNTKSFNKFIPLVINKVDYIFCASEKVKGDVSQIFPLHSPIIQISMGNSVIETPTTDVRYSRYRGAILMIGTLEPRKNYEEVLNWYLNYSVKRPLVIIGRRGWKCRKTIAKIKKANKYDKRIYWLENIKEDALEQLIAGAALGICASLDEGFGLPLREFLRRGTPVIASDIAIFREGVNEGVEYFAIGDLDSLNSAYSRTLLNNELRPLREFPDWSDSAREIMTQFGTA